MSPRALLSSLLLVPLACGDSTASTATDTSSSTSSSSSSSTTPTPTTSDGPGTSTTTGSSSDSSGSSTGTTDPITGTSTTSSTGTTSTTGTTTGTSTGTSTGTTTGTSTTTTGTGTDTDTGGDPPPDTMPELVCPGDPDGHCDPIDGAAMFAGASVTSIIPSCFETWNDVDDNDIYEPGTDTIADCGCDRLCPGDPGYTIKDAGEGDGQLQVSWLAGFQNARAAMGVRGADLGLVGEGDGLWARALVIEQGNTRLAIVTLDLVGWMHNETLAIRETLAGKGFEVDYVLIHAIHNHEGPDTMGLWGPQPGVSGYDPAYRAQVREAVIDTILAADAAKVEVASMRVGEVDTSTYHENGVGNVISDHRDPWVVDEMIGAFYLVGKDDQPIASLVSFGNHPESMADENHLMTSDFVHGVRRTLESGSTWTQAEGKQGLGVPCLYVNAAVGGMMTPLGVTVVNPDGDAYSGISWEKTDSIGQLLGEMALDALDLGDTVPTPQMDLQAHKFKARVDNESFNLMFQLGVFDREVFLEMDGMYIETEMALINLGPLQLLSVPGELLPELAVGGYDGSHVNSPNAVLIDPNNPNPPNLDLAPEGPYLKDRMHGTYRWIVGLGNDEIGYILPEYDFVLGDPPWVTEADGDHYEETNSLGGGTAAKVEASADILIAWSKWVHGLP